MMFSSQLPDNRLKMFLVMLGMLGALGHWDIGTCASISYNDLPVGDPYSMIDPLSPNESSVFLCILMYGEKVNKFVCFSLPHTFYGTVHITQVISTS
jgi:hypothetical protein